MGTQKWCFFNESQSVCLARLRGIHLRPGRLTFQHQRRPPQFENPPGRGTSQQRRALISSPDGGVDRGDMRSSSSGGWGGGEGVWEVGGGWGGRRSLLNACQTRVELFRVRGKAIIKNIRRRGERKISDCCNRSVKYRRAFRLQKACRALWWRSGIMQRTQQTFSAF